MTVIANAVLEELSSNPSKDVQIKNLRAESFRGDLLMLVKPKLTHVLSIMTLAA
jgi:hypothetical protein